jgi:cytochrome c556
MLRPTLALLFLFACKQPQKECPPPVQCPPASAAVVSDAAATVDAGPPPNVVQTEMRILTDIMETTIRGIGNNDVRGIAEQLHKLHAAKEATGAAVKGGTYKLPKNPDQLATFEQMDEAFHKQLGALVTASSKNDVPAAANALSEIVKGCPGCHATFRPDAPKP